MDYWAQEAPLWLLLFTVLEKYVSIWNLIQKRKKKKAKGCKLQRDEQMSFEMLRKK
jgi:hypothetical protein